MTYDPLQPRYVLPFAGRDYDLLGTFAMLEAIETALKDNVLRVMVRTTNMPVSDLKKLVHAVLSSNGYANTQAEIAEALFNKVGIGTDDYAVLTMHLYAFLRIVLARPDNREEVHIEMGKLIAEANESLKPTLGEGLEASATQS
jgi:hypothetical protein